jgi:hypothetical protein
VRTRLGDQTKIRNIHRSGELSLVRGIKDGIERNVLENFVEPELVRVENHTELTTLQVPCVVTGQTLTYTKHTLLRFGFLLWQTRQRGVESIRLLVVV